MTSKNVKIKTKIDKETNTPVVNVFARHEIKYLVNYEQRKLMEKKMAEYMIPDVHGVSTICNIYYDTPDFRLIRHSLEKPVYKEKLRLRSYGPVSSSDDVFLELKKKYKGVVYKRRIELSENMAMAFLAGTVKSGTSLWLPEERDRQIAKEIEYFRDFYQGLAPRVHLSYDRCAYFSKDDPNLRLTFDRHIRWRDTDISLTKPAGGYDLLDRGYSLMEIKTASAIPMWMVKILDEGEMRKTSFSKYGKAYESILENELLKGWYGNEHIISEYNDGYPHGTELYDKSSFGSGSGSDNSSGSR